MSINLKIFLVSVALVAFILFMRYLARKGSDAVDNAIAKKKNEKHTNNVGKEQNLSDIYQK